MNIEKGKEKKKRVVRDVDLAEEEAKNGERAKEDDKDVGEKRDETSFSIRTVVVHQRTTDQHDHRSP